MLARTPALARHVQKLLVHPESSLKNSQPEFVRSWNHARTVSSLVAAASKHMDALRHFGWDGEDTLPDDRMWADLRRGYVPFATSHHPDASDTTPFQVPQPQIR